MKKQVREYTQEFKEEAVKHVLKSHHLTRTARDLGIPVGTLNSWVRQLKGKTTTPSSPIVQPQDIGLLMEENRRLHKELNIVKEEREILKKAAAYFAQHQK